MGATRLPLQLGANSLWHGFRGSVTFVPGVIAFLGAAMGHWGSTGWIAGAVLFFYGLYQLVSAWQTRACDVLLDSEAVVLDGGPHHGLRIPWQDIDLGKTSCKKDSSGTMTLVLGLRRGASLTLAEAEHEVEHDSIEALYSTIRNRVSPPQVEPPKNPELWSCQSCGAALVPVAAEKVHCGYCGTANTTPESLRGKLRSQAKDAANRKAIASMVEELMKQPGARHASIVQGIYSLLSVLPWVAIAGTLFYLGFEYAGGFEVGFAIVAGLLGALTLFVWARSALVKRRALQMLTTAFAAQKVGNQVVCRQCQAPLPATEGELLCRCAYCETENIVGIDVSRRQKESSKRRQSLKGLIESRRKERRRWRLFALGSLFVGAVAALMSLMTVIVAAEFAEEMEACKKDDAEACYSVALDLSIGGTVGKDEAKSYEFRVKACELGQKEACVDLIDVYYYGWGTEEDEERAVELANELCQQGEKAACEWKP